MSGSKTGGAAGKASLTSTLAGLVTGLAALVHVDADRIVDPDLFVNLYTGREILARGGVPGVDVVTFSVAGRPWMDYEWLARVLFFVMHERLGAWSLVVLRGLVATGVLAVLYRLVRRYDRSSVTFAALTGFFMAGAASFFIFRTTLFTFFGLAVLFAILQRAREDRPAIVWVVPPMMVAWVNLHAGFALGISLLGMAAAESVWLAIVRRMRGSRSAGAATAAAPGADDQAGSRGRPPGIPWPHAVGALAASVALTGLNPFGYRNWIAVLHTMTSPFTPHISEWTPMHAQSLSVKLPVYLLMVLLGITMLVAWRSVGPFELFVALSMGMGAFRHARFAPLFTIAACSLLARLLPAAWRAFPALPATRPLRKQGASAPRTDAVVLGLAILVCGILIVREGHRDLIVRKVSDWTPVGGVKFLQVNGFEGEILNEYDWGGYIRYMLPRCPIFIDGRSDTVYPFEVIGEWGRFVNAKIGGYSVPYMYGAQAAFVRRLQPVVETLRRDSRWLYAYADDTAAIFVRDSPENASFVTKLRTGATVDARVIEEDYRLR